LFCTLQIAQLIAACNAAISVLLTAETIPRLQISTAALGAQQLWQLRCHSTVTPGNRTALLRPYLFVCKIPAVSVTVKLQHNRSKQYKVAMGSCQPS
jgi:hypothetical protein